MMVARIAGAIQSEWACVAPVCVGGASEGVRAARYVVVEYGDDQLLRVDVHAYGPDCFAFEEVLIWRGHVVIGFGSHVHLVSIHDRAATTLALGSYFGHLYPTDEYLLAASGERVFRIEPSGRVLWTSDVLGIDGVLVNDAGPPIIRGEGEWDPPGGWAPFELLADSGRCS